MLLANRVMSAVRNILSQDIPQTASRALNFLGKTANYGGHVIRQRAIMLILFLQPTLVMSMT
jgi:hypothetical protein